MKMEIVILGSHAIVKKKKKEVPTKVLWYAGGRCTKRKEGGGERSVRYKKRPLQKALVVGRHNAQEAGPQCLRRSLI
jgi:hypothetical protein